MNKKEFDHHKGFTDGFQEASKTDKPSCPACDDIDFHFDESGVYLRFSGSGLNGSHFLGLEENLVWDACKNWVEKRDYIAKHPPEPAKTAMDQYLADEKISKPKKPEPVENNTDGDLEKVIDKLGDTLNNLAEDYNSLLVASHTLKEGAE